MVSDKVERSRPTSESSSVSEEEENVPLPTPPDGGWGWVVVMASFVVHMIADGCSFSYGVLYTELLEALGESKGKTAMVGSLFVSVPLMTGPIASALTNKYGCRATTIVGGLVAGVGVASSAWAQNIDTLCFTFGVVAGFGLSMVFVPAVVVVAYYFETKRAFATGLAVAGSGIGTFVFAPFTEYLIAKYSWRGTMLILGGIMFKISVCGALFRPLENPKRRRRNPPNTPPIEDASKQKSVLKAKPKPFANNDDGAITHSLLQFPTYLQKDLEKLPPDIVRDLANQVPPRGQSPNETFIRRQLRKQTLDAEACRSQELPRPSKVTSKSKDAIWRKQGRGSGIRSKHNNEPLQPMYRQDIFYRGSLFRQDILGDMSSRSASCPDIVMHNQKLQEEEEQRKTCNALSLLRLSIEVKHIILKMLDVAILKKVVFVYFAISCMILYMWYDVPYIFTVDRALQLGISEDAASFLISIIGITSTIGQVLIGYIGDQPRVNSLLLYNLLTSTAGLLTCIVPKLPSYTLLSTYCAAYGFFISGNYALTTIILVDLLGMEKLTNAYGLVMLAQGIANLIGPPVAGWISDQTGSYDIAFYVAGLGILLSGVMLFGIPWLNSLQPASVQHQDPELAAETCEKKPEDENLLKSRSNSADYISQVETVI